MGLFDTKRVVSMGGLAFFLSFGMLLSSDLLANTWVTGYPVDGNSILSKPPTLDFGDDPIIGRLMCPPLTRYNLKQSKAEPVVLKSVEERLVNGHVIWDFELRTGINWWDGSVLDSTGLAGFLNEELSKTIKAKLSISQIPSFSIATNGLRHVLVSWHPTAKGSIEFGPFILNGVPLWKPSSPKGEGNPMFQCVGLFVPATGTKDQFVLSPVRSAMRSANAAKGIRSAQVIFTNSGDSVVKAEGDSEIHFLTAKRFGQGHALPPETGGLQGCNANINLPLLSAIVWNPTKSFTSNPEFRKALTQLLPRGEIVRTLSSSLGDLLSGPFPRLHPGYKRDILVRPYSLEAGSKILDDLGYSRGADGVRISKDGRQLRLKIAATAGSRWFIEKVVTDALALAGITVEAVELDSSSDGTAADLDGILLGIRLPWPEVNLFQILPNITDSGIKTGLPWSIEDDKLKNAMKAYAQRLSRNDPSAVRLAPQIHERFSDLEPWTIFMQHRACVSKTIGVKGTPIKLDERDSDWFRALL